jgi:uncharacterized membrane protein YqaE (UPF0057 family)
MKILWYVIAILFPFVAVLLKTRNLAKTLIALLLTLLGWIPGAIYALYVVAKSYDDDPLEIEEE